MKNTKKTDVALVANVAAVQATVVTITIMREKNIA